MRPAVACLTVLFTVAGALPDVAAQSPPAADLSGIWIASAPDVSTLLVPGEEIAFTPYGADRYQKVDQANAPSYKCLPYGPTRGLQSTNPFQIIQGPGLVAILTEHIDYRLIYTDGRPHPEDILDYPEWMGHSIGRWEGDTLVVDTIGMREETWLDTAGFEHSAKLHLVERFQKAGPDNLRITVTVDDPVFFTKPWSYTRVGRRMAKDVRMMPARCADNENSLDIAQTGRMGAEHKNPPRLPR
jgi:hypothetical protein